MNVAITSAALPITSALFDSIWQGALVAAAVWAGLRLAPRIGASTRSAIWVCALVALAALPAVTLFGAVAPQQNGSIAAAAPASLERARTARPSTPHAKKKPGAAVPAESVIDVPAPASTKPHIDVSQALAIAVAFAWLAAAGWRGALLLSNLIELVRIRRESAPWSVAHGIPVVLSHRIRVPIAIGFLRGAVVLPVRLVDELSPDAIEAIVVHEIAHLRRYDVWTNALVRVVEALVALNPVAWFVSRRISIEREIACDDWVVARLNAGEIFARTLAGLATGRGTRAPLGAPSAIGSKHAVVERVERLLDGAPRRLRLSAALLGATLALIAVIAIAVRSVSPVLAYEPQATFDPGAVAASDGTCSAPNRGIRTAVPFDLTTGERKTYWYELDDAKALVAKFGAANVALVDLTITSQGIPSSIQVQTPGETQYPGGTVFVGKLFMHAKYEPALRNCVAVTSTIHTGIHLEKTIPDSLSTVSAVYPDGWSSAHPASCKVPQLLHTGVPAFPASLAATPIGEAHSASARVAVDANGAVTSATIVSSSGVPAFDVALLAAARAPTYPLSESTGFKPVRPSNASLAWNAAHGYAQYSQCTPKPAEYVWNTTYKRLVQTGLLGSTIPASILGMNF